MNRVRAVVGIELLDFRRNRFSLLLLGLFSATVVISVVVASLNFGVKMDAYKAYTEALAASGSKNPAPAPQLFPLQLLRGGIEYLEILGALFALIVGYASIAKEKQRGTLSLLFSRSMGKYPLAWGKLLSLALVWLGLVLVVFTLSLITALIAGHAQIAQIDLSRLLIAGVAAWLYLVVWSSLAMAIASISSNLSNALIVSVVLWLVCVLVIPQIGDTMDPDNQVPGGLFKTLQIAKADETAVLANFDGYNNARDALEVSSVTKHFERFVFGFLGIKDKYNQQSLGFVWDGVWNNALSLWLFALGTIGFSLFTTKPKTLLRTAK